MLNNAPKGHNLRSSRQLLKVRSLWQQQLPCGLWFSFLSLPDPDCCLWLFMYEGASAAGAGSQRTGGKDKLYRRQGQAPGLQSFRFTEDSPRDRHLPYTVSPQYTHCVRFVDMLVTLLSSVLVLPPGTQKRNPTQIRCVKRMYRLDIYLFFAVDLSLSRNLWTSVELSWKHQCCYLSFIMMWTWSSTGSQNMFLALDLQHMTSLWPELLASCRNTRYNLNYCHLFLCVKSSA